MNKWILLLPLLLVACTKEEPKLVEERRVNQCLKRELFVECMKVLPSGPQRTGTSNDWDEVVDSCTSYAVHTSVRNISQIPVGCL